MSITKLDAVSLRSFYLANTRTGTIMRWVRNGKTTTHKDSPYYEIPVCLESDRAMCGRIMQSTHGNEVFRSHREAREWLDEVCPPIVLAERR